MRAEIGQMTLDRTLAERAYLNSNIVDAINAAAEDWGIRCLRYEIRKQKKKYIFNLYCI
jgi:regulator of protease activity HflC (stomatin/prohibitin superfamily)